MSDTNVALRAHNKVSSEHLLCRAAVDQIRAAGHEMCFCAQVMIEYWSVATRSATVNGLGQSVADVARDLAVLTRTFTLLPEPPDMATLWLDLVTRYSVVGRQVHDARLATLMLAHGVTHILTLNGSDFMRYEGIVCLHPSNINSNIEDILHGGP